MIQPWASFFLFNETYYESRTWKTNYRGILAIHTSKKIDHQFCSHKTIPCLLDRHGLTPETLPTGVIIGICNLVNCLRVIEDHQESAILEDGRIISGNEYFLGDYRVGNYAWEVSDKEILPSFILAQGKLGLWEYDKELK
ncbi:2-oxoglutarate dehydrogenase E1 [Metasolibacillus meyeri]|uniref:2-oxoglutarate dehydrogenase E1 n=1 Tax=Metasolibacillus meyeri TaxID=1071052 RepID=A0AAW9NZB7_9BACL|nr:2-oxoglutarate dehydrogenase E1 [Metasolibacillus meyeri]MEC1180368.1 2-oxoglutarate dehydrogenase E1 [Metasolibacillus meyeri]